MAGASPLVVGIFGASNQVGRVVLDRLATQGCTVHAWSRRPSTIKPTSRQVTWHQHTLPAPVTWPSTLTALVYSAPMSMLEGVLIQAPPLHRLVVVSSMSAEAKAHSPSEQERALARSLRVGEQQAMEWGQQTGTPVVIVRPTMIYGYGLDQNIARMQRFIQRFRFFPLPPGPYGLRQPVHADRVGQLIVRMLHADVAGTIEVGGPERLPYDQLVRSVFVKQGLKPRIVTLPLWLLRALMRWQGGDPAVFDRIGQDQVADNTQADRLLQ